MSAGTPVLSARAARMTVPDRHTRFAAPASGRLDASEALAVASV